MDDGKKARMAAFVKDLEELSRMHGFAVDGCGCCGSPFLIDLVECPTGGYVYNGDGSGIGWEYEK